MAGRTRDGCIKVLMTNTTVTRRSFLAGISAAVIGWRADASAQSQRLETVTQWLKASLSERAAGVKACLDRIRDIDTKIQ